MKKKTGKVRIIAGKWRSRQILFPSLPNLRPTQDRVRVTVFNWLVPYIAGAVCLDMFAGTGALGFEALSRGAVKTVFIEREKILRESLQENAEILGATEDIALHAGQCPNDLPQFSKALFDIVFIDPPFYKGLIADSIKWLVDTQVLKKNAVIYLECEKELSTPTIPVSWEIIKESKTAAVKYYLCLNRALPN